MNWIHAFYLDVHLLGTGFSEQQLEERSASLRSKVIQKPKVILFLLLAVVGSDFLLMVCYFVLLFFSIVTVGFIFTGIL